jgi:hypothetical protein
MNTYNILVDGKNIITEITSDKLEGTLNIVRGLVWTSGGSDINIQVIENNLKENQY